MDAPVIASDRQITHVEAAAAFLVAQFASALSAVPLALREAAAREAVSELASLHCGELMPEPTPVWQR